MPNKTTLDRARKARRQGKAASTQAGEFVHEEIDHVRRGKHGARSTRQAIAIGLNKARRSGVPLAAPRRASQKTRRSAESALRQGGRARTRKPSPRRSRAVSKALGREGRSAASRTALSRQARSAARTRRRAGSSTPAARRRRSDSGRRSR
jgi:hypothetical protein